MPDAFSAECNKWKYTSVAIYFLKPLSGIGLTKTKMDLTLGYFSQTTRRKKMHIHFLLDPFCKFAIMPNEHYGV